MGENIYQLLVKDANGNEVTAWRFQFPSTEAAQKWVNAKRAAGEIGNDLTVEIVDVTSVGKQEREIAFRRQKQEAGRDVLALVAVLNDQKNLGLSDFKAMLADSNLQMIKALLETGGLESAKALIQGISSPWFTDADKSALVKVIDDSGLLPGDHVTIELGSPSDINS